MIAPTAALVKQHLDDLLANNVKFRVIGDLSHLPESIRETVQHAEQVTSTFHKYKLNIAYNYDVIRKNHSIGIRIDF